MLLVAHLGTPCTVYRAGAPGTKVCNIFRRKAAHICRASNASQPAHSYSSLATSRPPSSPKEAEDASTSSSAPQQDDPDVVWYFAYGADMSWESLKRCNVRVASRDAAFVRDPRMRLVFRHRGGLPTLEPEPPSPPPAASSTPPPNSLQQRLSSSQQSSSTTSHPSSSGSSEAPGSVSSRALSSPAGPWPIRHSSLPSRSAVTTLPSDPAQPAASLPSIPRVHGVLYRTTRAELRKMRQRDMGYMLQELEVETYGGRTVPALVFVSGPLAVLPHSVAPPESYISSMREGAAFNFIDPVYQAWLSSITSVTSVGLGSEYYNSPSRYIAYSLLLVAVAVVTGFFFSHRLP